MFEKLKLFSMESNDKVCINCQKLGYDSVRQHYCSLTNLPVETSGTCDNFREIEKTLNKKKNSKLMVPVLIFIGFCLIAFIKYAKKVEHNKEVKKVVERVVAEKRRELNFHKYAVMTDTLGLKRYKGVFYTYDSNCTEVRFENAIYDYFFKLPETINKFDTIFLENVLVTIQPDSSMIINLELNGYLIKSFNGRRYVKLK